MESTTRTLGRFLVIIILLRETLDRELVQNGTTGEVSKNKK